MPGQVKKNSGKILSARQIIDKVLEFTGLEQSKMAMNCGIKPDTLRKAIDRDVLTDEIILKISGVHGVRKEFLETGEEPIKGEKPTPATKTEQADILDHPLVLSYKSEIQSLNKIIKLQEEEIARLRGGK